MDNREDEELKKHLEEVKLLDQDLFEENFEEDQNEVHYKEQKKKKGRFKKPLLAIISFLLLLSIIGPLAETLNIATISFLKKSYELSQRSDIQDYKEAVVTIKAENSKGTGFNISPEGVIVTNDHVIGDQDKAIVHFPDGPTENAKVIKKIPEIDIAILKLDNQSKLPYLKIDPSKQQGVGDHIYFIGNPLMFNGIANEGEVIGTTDSSDIKASAILIDAPVYKGNSGSPVINQEGKVIGVIYAKGTITQDGKRKKVGFAIPINVLPNEYITP